MSEQPPADALYRDAEADVADRVADLLGRMTLEEKTAQMMGVWNDKGTTLIDPETGAFDIGKARRAFGHGNGIGQVGRPSDAGATLARPELGRGPREQAELTNAIQRFFVEESRLDGAPRWVGSIRRWAPRRAGRAPAPRPRPSPRGVGGRSPESDRLPG